MAVNAPNPFANHRLRRGIYLLPSLCTVANLVCGYYAIMATLKGAPSDFDKAAQAIGFAILLDMLDGFIARATGTSSEFGKQFDSLADVISFGMAPAFLAFAWGVRGVAVDGLAVERHVIQLGWLVSCAFVVCAAWRLARFNIQGMAPGMGLRYFVGLPSPAAAALVAACIHAAKDPVTDWRFALGWLAIVATAAMLMLSTVRYKSFKDLAWFRRQPSVLVVALALLVAAIIYYSEQTLLLMAGSYVAAGLAVHLVRFLRHRLAASHSA